MSVIQFTRELPRKKQEIWSAFYILTGAFMTLDLAISFSCLLRLRPKAPPPPLFPGDGWVAMHKYVIAGANPPLPPGKNLDPISTRTIMFTLLVFFPSWKFESVRCDGFTHIHRTMSSAISFGFWARNYVNMGQQLPRKVASWSECI